MTKQEEKLLKEIRAELESLVRQYGLHVEVQERLVQELRELKEENTRLKLHNTMNGQCYFYSSGPQLPWKPRG